MGFHSSVETEVETMARAWGLDTLFNVNCRTLFLFQKTQKKSNPGRPGEIFLATRNGGNIAIFSFGLMIEVNSSKSVNLNASLRPISPRSSIVMSFQHSIIGLEKRGPHQKKFTKASKPSKFKTLMRPRIPITVIETDWT